MRRKMRKEFEFHPLLEQVAEYRISELRTIGEALVGAIDALLEQKRSSRNNSKNRHQEGGTKQAWLTIINNVSFTQETQTA